MLPENCAIVVVEMNVDDVLSMQCKCVLDIIIAYDVSNASDSKQEHQFSVPSITIDTDVLHDKRFAVQFEANECKFETDATKMEHFVCFAESTKSFTLPSLCIYAFSVVFRDLLSVICTTEQRIFLIRFQDDDRIIKFYDCMEEHFGFDKLSTSLDLNEVNFMYNL